MFEGYGIKENPDGTVTGKPVWFTRYGETFLNLGIPDASASFRKNGQLLRAYNDNLLNLASAWTRAGDASEKEELARMYVMMTRHLLDQGFAAGSAQGTLHHLGYSMRNFYIAPVLMRDVLRKAGLSSEVQVFGSGRSQNGSDGAGNGHRCIQHIPYGAYGLHSDAGGQPV